jgi:2-oxo-4-hydroxy-4-carboxy-5-ureidoimidazoline decarboxylase
VSALPDLSGRPVAQDSCEAFLKTYGHLFERSPWVVERTWAARPFVDAAALHAAFMLTLEEAPPEDQFDLLRSHPELADKVTQAEGLTEESEREQASAGLDRLSAEEYARFHELNRAYRDRFGFPFIICVRLHDKAGILGAMQTRLGHEPETEFEAALQQVGLIVQLRMGDIEDRLGRV